MTRTRIAARIVFVVVLALATLVWPVNRSAHAQSRLDPMMLTKYLDPLPNPLLNVLQPVGSINGVDQYEVAMTQFSRQLHSELPATTLWGYNGSYPGPTFQVRRDQPINVKWTNNLVDAEGMPLPHLLPVDTTLHGVDPEGGHMGSNVQTVVHLHGAAVEARSDGNPEYWFTADETAPANGMGGPAGNSDVYRYDNRQDATALWYHDHALGMTRLNVYAGLAGMYLIRDAREDALNLPRGPYEMPLVLQDRSFYEDGQLFYPHDPSDAGGGHGNGNGGELPPDFPSEHSVVPEFFGDTNLVNGAIWPYMEVEPRKYRFRMLNGSNSRFYELALESNAGQPVTLNQIGADGGLLPARVELDELMLAPAERADVIVDFSSFAPGTELFLRNYGPDAPFMGHGMGMEEADPETTGQVMQFRVVPLTAPDTSLLPDEPFPRMMPDPASAAVTRSLTLSDSLDQYGRVEFLLDGKDWEEPTTELPRAGTAEIWEFFNTTQESHPMHLHGVQFQVLDRQMLMPMEEGNPDAGWMAEIDPDAPMMMPEDNELGLKDTVRANPGEVTRVFVQFGEYTGEFTWHCHILEHEDYSMMRPMKVVPEPSCALLLVVSTVLGYGAVSARGRC